VCSGAVFQRLRTGITWLPVLRAASRVKWAGVRKAAAVTQINLDMRREEVRAKIPEFVMLICLGTRS
jgi:hypothetical protein